MESLRLVTQGKAMSFPFLLEKIFTIEILEHNIEFPFGVVMSENGKYPGSKKASRVC
jgi:hypothetical protein